MKNLASISISREKVRITLFDVFAIAFIYFVPAISHVLRLPVYLIEPMRIMLILSIAHTTRRNAYLIALSLPFFSFLISAHPSIIKTVLISFELVVNVFLFFVVLKQTKRHFLAILSSIVVSKGLYYLIKFSLINLVLMNTTLIATPLYIQGITTLVFSVYIYFIFRNRD